MAKADTPLILRPKLGFGAILVAAWQLIGGAWGFAAIWPDAYRHWQASRDMMEMGELVRVFNFERGLFLFSAIFFALLIFSGLAILFRRYKTGFGLAGITQSLQVFVLALPVFSYFIHTVYGFVVGLSVTKGLVMINAPLSAVEIALVSDEKAVMIGVNLVALVAFATSLAISARYCKRSIVDKS